MVDRHVVSDDRRFTDDDTDAVVDEYPPTDRRGGVYVDIGDELGDSHDETSEKFEAPFVKFVGDAVVGDRPNPWIVEKEFEA